jgi:hypothetical protein
VNLKESGEDFMTWASLWFRSVQSNPDLVKHEWSYSQDVSHE